MKLVLVRGTESMKRTSRDRRLTHNGLMSYTVERVSILGVCRGHGGCD